MKKLLLLVLVPVLLLGGGFAAVYFGLVKIPGLKLGPLAAQAMYAVDQDHPEVKKLKGEVDKLTSALEKARKPVAKAVEAVSGPDPAVGQAKLAGLWNKMSPTSVGKLAEGWNPVELSRVLAKMDPDRAAKVLEKLPPKLAGEVSKAYQREAAM